MGLNKTERQILREKKLKENRRKRRKEKSEVQKIFRRLKKSSVTDNEFPILDD